MKKFAPLMAIAMVSLIATPALAKHAGHHARKHAAHATTNAAGAMKGDAMHSDAMKGDAMHSDAMHSDAMKGDAMKGDAMHSDAMKPGKPN